MTAEAFMNLAAIVVVGVVCVAVCALAGEDTRRRLGCWLIASAKTHARLREVKVQLKIEQKLYQMQLEERHVGRPTEEEKRIIEVAS